jgi:glycosyltransferase involved in cell wall biosynthesis
MIEAIDAILAQTFTDFELIISDNASQDGTPEICRELVARDSRVRYYRNPTNIGAVGNHNRLVELARGEYFKWTGHDDLIEPTFLEKCVGVLDADTDGRYVLCFTKLDYIDDDGEPMPGGIQAPVFADDRPSRRLRSFWSAQRMHQVQYGVIRRDRLVRTALEGEWYGSDRQLLMELALLGGFARVDEVLFHHREHRGRSEFVRDKSGWMSTARSGSLDMGYWRRIALVSEILERDYLTPRERRAVLREYLRYAAVRATHWIPQLSRELAGAAARGVATVTKGPARVQ